MDELELKKYIQELVEYAVHVLGDEKTANDWMNSHIPALGCEPRILLYSKQGCDEVRRVLGRLFYGVYS